MSVYPSRATDKPSKAAFSCPYTLRALFQWAGLGRGIFGCAGFLCVRSANPVSRLPPSFYGYGADFQPYTKGYPCHVTNLCIQNTLVFLTIFLILKKKFFVLPFALLWIMAE